MKTPPGYATLSQGIGSLLNLYIFEIVIIRFIFIVPSIASYHIKSYSFVTLDGILVIYVYLLNNLVDLSINFVLSSYLNWIVSRTRCPVVNESRIQNTMFCRDATENRIQNATICRDWELYPERDALSWLRIVIQKAMTCRNLESYPDRDALS